jgi:hypothetical protein
VNKFAVITDDVLSKKGVQALATRPNISSQYGVSGLTAEDLKKWFDNLGELTARKINEVIEALASENAGEYIRVNFPLKEGEVSLYDLVASITSGELATLMNVGVGGKNLAETISDYAKNFSDNEEKHTSLDKDIDEINEELDSQRKKHLHKVGLSINRETYVISMSGVNEDDEVISTASVDLPLESVVVNGAYNNGVITLTLQNGNTIEIPVTSLVDGLVTADQLAYVQGELEKAKTALSEDIAESTEKAYDYTDTAKRDLVEAINENNNRVKNLEDFRTEQKATNTDYSNRLSRLENAAFGESYATVADDSQEYIKIIPDKANPKAIMGYLGGKSYVHYTVSGEQNFPNLSGDMNGLSVTSDGNGVFTLNGTLQPHTYCFADIEVYPNRTDIIGSVLTVISGRMVGNAVVALTDVQTMYFPTVKQPLESKAGEYSAIHDISGKGENTPFDSVIIKNESDEAVTFTDYVFSFVIGEFSSSMITSHVTAVKAVGKNLVPFKNITETTQSNGITYESLGDGGIHVYGTSTDFSDRYFTARSGIPLPVGYKMTRSGVQNGQNVSLVIARMKKDATASGGWRVDTYMGDTFDTIEGDYQYRIYLQVYPGKTVDLVVYPMLEAGAKPTAFAPYTERVYAIPDAVQELDGYGLGISSRYYNYIDFDRKVYVQNVAIRDTQAGDASSDTMLVADDKTLYVLPEAKLVDVSQVIDFADGVIDITDSTCVKMENKQKIGVPNVIYYQVREEAT